MSRPVSIFISHTSEEQGEANRAKAYLEATFENSVDVFVASNWESISPGDDWFRRIEDAITRADIMLVLCSTESMSRPWIQFESGAAWFTRRTKVIPVCYKGLTPPGLPDPMKRLQAIDMNATNEADGLFSLAKGLQAAANLPAPRPIAPENFVAVQASEPEGSTRGWFLRPQAYIGSVIEGVYRVGTVGASDSERAMKANLEPGDSLHVRLNIEPPNGVFLNAIVPGSLAPLFERDDIYEVVIKAKLKLVATHANHMNGAVSPVIVVEAASPIPVRR